MDRRKLASCLIAFLLGAAGGAYGSAAILVFAAYLLWQCRICAAGKIAGKKMGIYIIFLLAAFLAGGARAGVREIQSKNARSFFIQGEEAALLGTLGQKEQKEEKIYYYLKDNHLKSKKGTFSCPKILVILDSDSYSIGETLFIKGKMKELKDPDNEGGYNERLYYQSLNIDGVIEEASVEKSLGDAGSFPESLYRLRKKLSKSYEKCMKDTHAKVMAAMTLGEKSGMDQELKTLYQKAGVSHFYSISGIHLSILGMTLYRLLRKKCTCRASAFFAGAGILCYGCLTGFGISQTRAVGMFLILLYGKCRGKSYDLLTALSVLASLMVWENPKILYHMGFLLSFGAVAGVLFAGEVKKNCFSGSLPEPGDTLLVSVCIQLVTVPILCNSFYEISVYAVLVNLFILPFMGILLCFGMAGMAAGCVSVNAGKILLFPCGLILWFFERISRFSIGLPSAVFITGKLSAGRILLWYGGILFLFVLWKKKKYFLVRLSVCAAFCTLLLVCPFNRKTEWDVLDVGQGDGICFMEKDGTTMFLDGGSSSVSKVGTYRILPFFKYHGIRQIDYWFLSHLDDDHISGMQEVAESGFPIHTLVLAEGVVRDDAWQELVDFAGKRDIPILYMKKDAVLEGEKNWKITCLYPEDKNQETDRNNASMVLFYESGKIRGLFTGDLSKEQEQILAENYVFPRVDVLKASHHGSKFGTCEELLTVSSPKTAIISCGENNRYGHPGEETLKRLAEAGAAVFETRFAGQIKIRDGKIIIR